MSGLLENGWWDWALVCRGDGGERVVLVQWGTGKREMWTNVDAEMLWAMVETRVDHAVWFGHGEYQLENSSAQKGSRSTGPGDAVIPPQPRLIRR